MRTVAVYRSKYLALSETFISDHIRSLRAYRPVVITEFDQPAAHRVDLQPHTIWGGSWGRKALSHLGISPALDGFVKKEKPALVHAHFLTDAARILPFIERTKLPLIVTAHGYDAASYDQALMAGAEGQLLLKRAGRIAKAASAIICVSDFIKAALIERGYPESKLITLALGVETDKFIARDAANFGTGIVTVGRLVEKKGTRYLIEAYAKLPDDIRQRHPLTVIGEGPLWSALHELASNLRVSVNFAGGLPRTDVIKRVGEARVFCLPSIRAKDGDAEGMPIAIMEALALGVPTVVFKGQHMADSLAAKGALLAANDRDTVQLATLIETILRSDAKSQTLSKVARLTCEHDFSLETNTQHLEQIYDRFAL